MTIEVRVVIYFFSLLNTCNEDIRTQFDNTSGQLSATARRITIAETIVNWSQIVWSEADME
jgi:hypothetical protein